jgi:hypothetical protein
MTAHLSARASTLRPHRDHASSALGANKARTTTDPCGFAHGRAPTSFFRWKRCLFRAVVDVIDRRNLRPRSHLSKELSSGGAGIPIETAVSGDLGGRLTEGDDRAAKLKHQLRFLSARCLTPPDMWDGNARLRTLERIAGKNASKLDPQLRARVRGDLEKAAIEQLRAAGLIDEWLKAWDAHKEATARRLAILAERARGPAETESGASAWTRSGSSPRGSGATRYQTRYPTHLS